MRKHITALTAIAALAFTVGTGGLAANAAEPAQPVLAAALSPAGACQTGVQYNEVASHSVASYVLSGPYHAVNSTGQAITATFKASAGGSLSATVTGTISGGVNAGIATAQASVSNSISAKVSWTTSLSVTATVPAHSTRYARLTTNLYTVNIERATYNGNCVRTVLSSGTLKAPSTTGWVVASS